MPHTDAQALAILNEAFDNVEYLSDAEIEVANFYDEYDLTALRSKKMIEQCDRIRPKRQTPVAPRRAKLDTRNSIEAICDGRIAAHDRKMAEPFKQMIDNITAGTGDALGQVRADWKDENAALRRKLNAAEKKIAELETRIAAVSQPIGYKIDAPRYRAVPFYADGKPGKPLDVRPFFQQFLNEITQ